MQDGIKWLKQVVITRLRLLNDSSDGTRAATKNKVEIHIFYFNLSIV